MGNSESSNADPHFVSACRRFTKKELEDLHALFISLAAQSQSNLQYITPSVFQAFSGIHGSLGERIFDLVTQERNDQKLTYQDLIITKASYEKGTRDEIDNFIYQILDINGDGFVNRSDLEAALLSMHETIFSSKCLKDGCNSYLNIVEDLLNAATFSEEVRGTTHTMSFNEFRNWCNLLPSVRKFLGGLLTGNSEMLTVPGRFGSPVPRQLYPEDLSSVLIMREHYAWVIGGALSQHELEEWKLLYHSSVDGLSFNTFLGNMTLGNGPTILLVKDKAGYIYGGYASQPWDRHSEFYGDMKSFLFTLHPCPSIFRPSGLNTNLQWCAWNFSSGNVPNGIGFGGRVNHFGLFLSASFDSGHSFQCSTFNSPRLSLEAQIVPETIECWGVTVKDVQQVGKPEPVKGNVLQRFKEDRHMLNMDGRRLKRYRGMGSLDAMTKGSDTRYLGDKSKLEIAQGVAAAVPDKGSVFKVIPYTMQAVRQGFQDLGVSSLQSAHKLFD